MTTAAKRPTLNNKGSLITYDQDGEECCLGYLMDFGPEHGIHDANFGQLDVTVEEKVIHNAALDKALLDGLDERCEIGQRGMFYFRAGPPLAVHTFEGTLVADKVRRTATTVTFVRKGKTFTGRIRKDADCINFKRIA